MHLGKDRHVKKYPFIEKQQGLAILFDEFVFKQRLSFFKKVMHTKKLSLCSHCLLKVFSFFNFFQFLGRIILVYQQDIYKRQNN